MDPMTILIGLVFTAVIIGTWIFDRRKRLEFDRRFPPISDDEFMARCPPGTNREIALKVRRILSDSLGVDYERIYPDSNLIKDLDCC